MNSSRPSAATATNGREPLAGTPAGRTGPTGRPAEDSAAAIPSGPSLRSGTPTATRTPKPASSPAAPPAASSAGPAAPLATAAAPPASSTIQAARRHQGRSQGSATTQPVTVTTASPDARPNRGSPVSLTAISAAASAPAATISPITSPGLRYRDGGSLTAASRPAASSPAVGSPVAGWPVSSARLIAGLLIAGPPTVPNAPPPGPLAGRTAAGPGPPPSR